MIPAQPILLVIFGAIAVFYFIRLRLRSSDGFAVLVCFAITALLVLHPGVVTQLANLVGLGRGVDLVVYTAIPGLLLLILVLFARTRDLNLKLTVALRELALANAHAGDTDEQS